MQERGRRRQKSQSKKAIVESEKMVASLRAGHLLFPAIGKKETTDAIWHEFSNNLANRDGVENVYKFRGTHRALYINVTVGQSATASMKPIGDRKEVLSSVADARTRGLVCTYICVYSWDLENSFAGDTPRVCARDDTSISANDLPYWIHRHRTLLVPL